MSGEKSAGPIAPPQIPVLLRQLLPTVTVPKRLVQEPEESVSHLMVDNRKGLGVNLDSRLNRSKIEIDVLGCDESRVKALESFEEFPSVSEVTRRIGDVPALEDELHSVEDAEFPPTDRFGPSRHDFGGPKSGSNLFQPLRVGDTVAVDERHEVPSRQGDSEVATDAARSEMLHHSELARETLGKLGSGLESVVAGQRVDDDDLKRGFLADEALEQATKLRACVPDGYDDRD